MVLEYLPTKLGNFVRANVGKYQAPWFAYGIEESVFFAFTENRHGLKDLYIKYTISNSVGDHHADTTLSQWNVEIQGNSLLNHGFVWGCLI